MSSPDIDLAALPAVRWPAPADVNLTLDIPPGGVVLGTDRSGRPVAVAALQPRPVRIGLLGHPAWATALAYRLLGVGCQVAVLTAGSQYWEALRSKVTGPALTWLDAPGSWPAVPGTPPTTSPGPQVLIVDYPSAPPLWVGDLPWCTVMHVTSDAPEGNDFWANVDTMLITAQGYAGVITRRWPHPDAAQADDLRPGEIALADRHGIVPIVFPPTP
ncbi:hypothetical protein Dvina_38465 [Dactylosporangium vinaceum]|uniref:Uncharacterized protein n=1 Tax=Dactylosporangium vinaceum TaxID=53362 RepID=A0ABV5ML31_9ACTN|nr:hypothetical protein [Dactylosporangium vinaceum]UAB94033.1 hypothetical protein Dvina_38465 [Dactylosporangium vinaceum]